ncbi:MAG: hypothetical protein HY898_12135 [Deltaproteobacteria bacterium]|nr:hypothetical protein [Deltaproteobacteria bacterium]
MKRVVLLAAMLVAACSDDSSSGGSWYNDAGAGTGGDPGTGGSSAGTGGGSQGGSSQGGSSQGGSSQGGSSQGGSSQGGSSQGGSSQGGSAGSGGAPHTPYCVVGCSAPADCVTLGAFPADEWSCDSGACAYKGCTSDQVCAAVYKSDKYVCRPSPYGSMNLCQLGCQTPTNCATDQGAFSAANYTCETDHCVYNGCGSDQECETTMYSKTYKCADTPGLGYKTCQKSCAAPADCAVPNSPAYDVTTWTCEQNICRYQGCPNDAACKASMSNQQYVCR